MHPTPILATFSNISGRPKDMEESLDNEMKRTSQDDIQEMTGN